jgi:predicted MFS family arabinose efflux permease
MSAANFVVGMGAFVGIGLVVPIANDLALTTSQTGIMFVAYAITYAILSPILSVTTQSIDRRSLMCIGMIVLAVANLATALSTGLVQLCLTRAMAGAGAALITPIAAVITARTSINSQSSIDSQSDIQPQSATPPQYGRDLALVFAGVPIAQVLGVPLGSYLGHTFGWQLSFWLVSGLSLPITLLLWRHVPQIVDTTPTNGLAHLRQVGRNPRHMILVAFSVFYLGALYTIFTYIGPLLETTMGFGRNGVTAVLAIGGIGAVAGNFFGGIISDHFGPMRSLLSLCAVQMCLLIWFSFLPVPLAALYVLIFFWAFFGWASTAAQQSRLMAQSRTHGPVLIALNAGSAYLAAALGAAVGSASIALFGQLSLGWVSAIIMGLALLSILVSQRVR